MNSHVSTGAQRGDAKTAWIPIKVEAGPSVSKPEWIRVRVSQSERFREVKRMLREAELNTVCEEASCPNIGECFGKGTATFMVLGSLCTRRCPFCDVAHGRPMPPDPLEPQHLADTVSRLRLKYVVITSVDRDDLRDGGAAHFAACIRAIRQQSPDTRIEVLTPDFRGRATIALDILAADPPDVMNHNIETVPRMYKQARPGADYRHSLQLLRSFKARCPDVPTKSGLMLGLGETDAEVLDVLRDMRLHGIDMVTVGQYLQPRPGNLRVERYVEPAQFEALAGQARALGFSSVACGPFVRSSYHADVQAHAVGVAACEHAGATEEVN
ncbi:lipoyl synthase [Pandoraea terrae]|uniref:Lipoyl synthase n=1 Tax=Pandoraea terrae TaxID=1537710 RepID=A0A5E4Y5F9_9BURK|nr:lipoyl synthase [Pandoraea terrae]VVE43552.1 lipoyl synthase [Pandoraea terrae]